MPLQLEKAKSIFAAAIEKPTAADRNAFLNEACHSDPELLHQVQVLVRAHFADDSLFDLCDPAVAMTVAQPDEIETPGTQIGPYKLREQIGEGGFGVVYVAEQEKPVARKVALKIIKPGMDTKDVIARFEAERQALALMDHPNLAKVLDAGATESGRPFFVMELVRGVPITDYCDEQKLSTRERLELFIEVCRAVQHAHQKGIIHRDLKPSNVMVTMHDAQAVPKVIDFGVSKALSGKLTDKTVYTAFGQMIGTPLYMSPEQAQMSGLDVDTRSDIFSLGVLLYELLTGTTPFDKETLQKSGFEEMRRIIREVEPPRPSARLSTLNAEVLSTVSGKRKVDARKLSRTLRGELDWIAMKALEKERNRRYESASAFAVDVERYLNDEAVDARPATVAYRLRKILRRNRNTAVAVSTILLAIIAFGTYYFHAANQLGAANDELETESKAKDVAIEAKNTAIEKEREAAGALREAVGRIRKQERHAKIALSNFQLNRALKQDLTIGLQWLGQALKSAPADADDLHRVLRINLDAWQRQTAHLQQMIELPDPLLAARFSPDGKTIRTIVYPEERYPPIPRKTLRVDLWDVSTGQTVGRPLQIPFGLSIPTEEKCFAVSSDGRTLLVTTGANTARIWNLDTRKPVGPPLVHPGRILRTGISSNGRVAMSISGNIARRDSAGQIHLWDATTGQPAGKPLPLEDSSRPIVALSPDGSVLAIADQKHVKLWKTTTMETAAPALDCPADFEVQKTTTVKQEITRINRLEFSPDGQYLLMGYSYHRVLGNRAPDPMAAVRIWKWETGQQVGGDKNYVQAQIVRSADLEFPYFVFNPRSETFLYFGNTTRAQLDYYSLAPNGRSQRLRSGLVSIDHQIWQAAFSSDGRILATKGRGLQFWDTAMTQGLGMALSHSGRIVGFAPKEHLLLTNEGIHLYLWKPPTSRNDVIWEARTEGLRDTLEPGTHPSAMVVPTRLSEPRLSLGSQSGIYCAVRFSDDGKTVTTAYRDDPVIRQQGFIERKRVSSSPAPGAKLERAIYVQRHDVETGKLKGPSLVIPDGWMARFSPDGKTFATVAVEANGKRALQTTGVGFREWEFKAATIQFWNTETWKPIGPPRKLKGKIRTLLLNRDATRLFLDRDQGDVVEVYDVMSWEKLARWQVGEGQLLAVSANGRRAVTSPSRGSGWSPPVESARLRDALTGDPIGPPLTHQGKVLAAAFRPDGRLLLTTGFDGIVRLWDAETGKRAGEPLRHSFFVSWAAFSRDGRTVLTGEGGVSYVTMQYWDLSTRKPLGLGFTHEFVRGQIAFSPDGRYLLTAGSTARCRKVPGTPMQGDPERISLWLQTITPRTLDAAGEEWRQSVETWKAARQRLKEKGGPPVVSR